MNRYQREVAEMDRRHHLLVRTLTFCGAAGVIVLSLWSAGLPPTVWFERIQRLLASDGSNPPASPAIVAPATTSTPLSGTADTLNGGTALAGTDSSISKTPQALHLVSTSPGRNAREGTAALGVDVKNPQIYGAGAILANGSRLGEIHADYVVLERNGQSTRLYRAGADRFQQEGNADLLLVGGVQAEAAPVVTTREVITDYLRPSPVYDGELLEGFVVYPGARSATFSQLGLQAGDVIITLNDAPFSDPAHAYEVFRVLAAGVAMTATIKRKDKIERLTLDGSHIVADQERANSAAAAAPAMSLGPPST